MTATVDLFVLETVSGAEEVPLYEPCWLFAEYADTSGLWKPNEKNELEFQVIGVGKIIDALFGDGPKRYGFTTHRQIVLVDYPRNEKQKRTLSSNKKAKNQYLVVRSRVMDRIQALCEKGKHSMFYAFSLEEFIGLLQKIPEDEMLGKGRNRTKPMNAFLSALETKGRIVFPMIGFGLQRDFPILRKAACFRSAIVDPMILN